MFKTQGLLKETSLAKILGAFRLVRTTFCEVIRELCDLSLCIYSFSFSLSITLYFSWPFFISKWRYVLGYSIVVRDSALHCAEFLISCQPKAFRMTKRIMLILSSILGTMVELIPHGSWFLKLRNWI